MERLGGGPLFQGRTPQRTRRPDQPAQELWGAIQAQRNATPQTAVIDAEDVDPAEGIDRSGVDPSQEELLIQVDPEQHDEFACWDCFPSPPPQQESPDRIQLDEHDAHRHRFSRAEGVTSECDHRATKRGTW